MAFWTDDIPAVLADFGVPVSITGQTETITGIFDRDYVPVGEVPVDSTGPALTCATADAPAHGATLTIDGERYTVRSVQPDGTGISVLRLEAL